MPLWAKVDVDMPTDEKLLGQPVTTRHLWTCLICLAKKQDHAGAINGFDCALLAGRFNLPRKCVAAALTHFQAARMVELDPDGTIRLVNFVERQGPEDTSAERASRYYQSHRETIREKRRVSRKQSNGVLTSLSHAVSRKTVSLEGEEEEERDKAKATASQGVKPPAPTAAVWVSYSRAFEKRYRVEPVRNATINGLLAHFVTRMPAADAPGVAEYFLSQSSAYYLKSGHSVKAMVGDAEKLHAGWSGGRTISTATEARQQDATQANLDGWADLMSPEGRNALVGK